ncbi:hypothetical protein HMPREF3185_02148 [Porphyromonas somerae]|uniref:Uncharacterized protein n=1 Tax=Porphyromonas somerae TaxID=322095 RepID=A0A134AZG7_9PORP|nr:hypothetical protein HMPREF3184_02148 [Porphyromonadaceae bacterium KA00676]KXB73080.1 hypothetical protein HMPREF3185_02148 [Porphyromonas somerae]
MASHPSRVRELKQSLCQIVGMVIAPSHPSRVRELKLLKGKI